MADWVIGFMKDGGYLTVALLMFLENLFPPIPSEIIMPLAGYAARQGGLDLFGVILAGSAGSLAGALFWYGVGLWVGTARLRAFAARHGRWLTLSPREVDAADAWFDRYGGYAVFFGRCVPGVRTLISVPAGVSEMKLAPFLAFTTAGTAIFTTFLAGAGWYLGAEYERVAHYLDPVSKLVLAAIVIVYVYRVVTFRREEPEPPRGG